MSPRDGAGHGSHTSSTAAGNFGVTMTIDGNTIGDGLGHGAGREDRDVQGLLGRRRRAGRLLQLRQRRGHQRRGRRRRRRHQLLDRRHQRVERARLGGPGLPRRVERRGVRRQLGRQQRARRQHARPPGALGDHGRCGDVPPRLPGRRARQRRALCRRVHDAVAADARPRSSRPPASSSPPRPHSMPVAASRARSIRHWPPARSSSATAA